MNNNFEKEVLYFIELVFNNIQLAKTRKNKIEVVFSNLKINLSRKEILIFNKNHSYILTEKQIKDYNFNQYLTKYLALLYFEKLCKYLKKELTFKEFADIKAEAPPIVKKLLEQKNNISEQLKILRKNRNIDEVQRYIDELYNHEFASEYMKYLIDRYYYNKKDIVRPKKNGLEKMFKLLLH